MKRFDKIKNCSPLYYLDTDQAAYIAQIKGLVIKGFRIVIPFFICWEMRNVNIAPLNSIKPQENIMFDYPFPSSTEQRLRAMIVASILQANWYHLLESWIVYYSFLFLCVWFTNAEIQRQTQLCQRLPRTYYWLYLVTCERVYVRRGLCCCCWPQRWVLPKCVWPSIAVPLKLITRVCRACDVWLITCIVVRSIECCIVAVRCNTIR